MSLNITTTVFDHNYYGAEIVGSNTYECKFYTLHTLTVFNEIEINGEEFQAVYQCGNGFLYGDYNCPNPDLLLSDHVCGAGTSRLIWKIWAAGESDIEQLKGEELKEFCESISDYEEYMLYTAAELLQIYAAIVDNGINAKNYMEELNLADAEEETEA